MFSYYQRIFREVKRIIKNKRASYIRKPEYIFPLVPSHESAGQVSK